MKTFKEYLNEANTAGMYEIMDGGRPIRVRHKSLEDALEWGKMLGARTLIKISRDGMPIGKKIWNPQTGKSKARKM